MYKYKTIMEYGSSAFKEALDNAIHFGWEPFMPATVNSETHFWMIVLRRAS